VRGIQLFFGEVWHYGGARSKESLRNQRLRPYVRFVRAPPSNGIGLIRSLCAK
jgi:hypothetical protein